MQKKVFISYSWGSREHQDWIVNLGTRLINDTVDVVLDRWSLKDGHDIHSFMEEMVKSDDIFRVLIVSDAKYKSKADDREGGVGTETQIITPNIYSHQKQEKFIPIVLERDEQGNPCLPIYLLNRKYIDFSETERFEDSYEELLRNILEAPAIPKPKLGNTPPLYITENRVNLSEANTKIRTLENQLNKNQQLNPKYISDFIDTVLDKLWEFVLDDVANDLKSYGDKLYETLKSYKPLREDYLKFVDIISSSQFDVDTDFFIEFFEQAPFYERPKEKVGSWSSYKFDIFKIIFQELFLYTIAISLKNKNYSIVADLLFSHYYFKDEYQRKHGNKRFTFLYHYHEHLEDYIRVVYKREHGFGIYCIDNLSTQISKEDFLLADTLCYFVGILYSTGTYDNWYLPTCSFLETKSFPLFEKQSSKKFFEKTKILFGVNDADELKKKLNEVKESNPPKMNCGRFSFNHIPFVYELINPETIAIFR